jgi:hypothetical protein
MFRRFTAAHLRLRAISSYPCEERENRREHWQPAWIIGTLHVCVVGILCEPPPPDSCNTKSKFPCSLTEDV